MQFRSLDQAAFKAILISLEVFHLLTAFFFFEMDFKKAVSILL
jgi:hypothetical protein